LLWATTLLSPDGNTDGVTNSMILTLTILLIFSLASNVLQQWLSHQNNAKWMRMFSVQQGIPLESMEGVKKSPVPLIPEVPKKRISIPIPGAQMFRRVNGN